MFRRKANGKPGGCGPGDLLLIIAGAKLKTTLGRSTFAFDPLRQESMGKFRHLMGTELGLRLFHRLESHSQLLSLRFESLS